MKTQSSGVKSFADIPKNKLNLSPGQYNPDKSFVKVVPDYQKSCIKFLPTSKYAKTFVEAAAKLKKDVPGPGTYSILDRV